MEDAVFDKRFEQVWQMFQEVTKEVKEMFKDVRLDFKEIEQRFKETEKVVEKTSQQIQASDRKLEKYFGKVKELDRNWGTLVEALFKPSVATQFQERGIEVVHTHHRVISKLKGETMEIDILLEDGDTVILVEVKTTLRVEHIDEHIAKRLSTFKRFFPRYADVKVYGAVAYIHVEENADRYAYKHGLFVLTFTSGDMVSILNDEKFIPKIWG